MAQDGAKMDRDRAKMAKDEAKMDQDKAKMAKGDNGCASRLQNGPGAIPAPNPRRTPPASPL
jgi:hypothetical protein